MSTVTVYSRTDSAVDYSRAVLSFRSNSDSALSIELTCADRLGVSFAAFHQLYAVNIH